ncbi:MAG: 6,7-dimethyl-8-ribityllumazine synthase, partial [Burkholderiaceae bacterium]|nr:6,7-dimethyl-8-ribityllumazine synthase [Burkholderiaceae bacterium]
MNDIDVFEADLNGQDLRIAIVQARFNEDHCKALS